MFRRQNGFLAFSPALIALALAAFASPANAQLSVASNTFADGDVLSNDQMFRNAECVGNNVSPEIHWTGAPEGTKSFAVTAFDPDAGQGMGWFHWAVWDIPVKSTGLAVGAGDAGGGKLPTPALQGKNDFGALGYGGPCPPVGAPPHRYVFTVYALKVESLGIPRDTFDANAGKAIGIATIESKAITGTFGR